MGSIREEYGRLGAGAFYAARGASYRNPHEELVARGLRELVSEHGLDVSSVLDLACGSGEVTLAVRELGGRAHGMDPYTGAAFLERTGAACEAASFEDVAAGALAGRAYSLVACSFAMHLAEPSRLAGVCGALAEVSGAMVILTPHKRPEVRREWGWEWVGEKSWAEGRLRCRGRVYRRA